MLDASISIHKRNAFVTMAIWETVSHARHYQPHVTAARTLTARKITKPEDQSVDASQALLKTRRDVVCQCRAMNT